MYKQRMSYNDNNLR